MSSAQFPEHIRMTATGFTHWSSGPGNLTFDPECPRCWYDAGRADLLAALEAALEAAVEGEAWQSSRDRPGVTPEWYSQAKAAIATATGGQP